MTRKKKQDRINTLPPAYNLSEAVHKDRIGWRQMANHAVEMIRIPTA